MNSPYAEYKTTSDSSIHLPSREELAALVKDLKLTKEKAHELDLVIRHAVADLQHFQNNMPSPSERKDYVRRVRELAKTVNRFKYECDTGLDAMAVFLPNDFLSFLGTSMTCAAMGAILGRDVYPKVFDIQNIRTDIRSCEQQSAPMREALGLKHGHLFLKAIVDQLDEALQKWIKLERLSKGGKPPQRDRKYLIYRLAEAAPDIIGAPAAIAIDGLFVKLCAAILPICGISSVGVEKAIPTIVRQMRMDHSSQREGKT
jgi:hypothetical protein